MSYCVMSVLTKALDSGASWVLDRGLRDGQSICFNRNKYTMVFSKHHPKKADTPFCLSDVSFAHFLSNIFPSLRHFTFSLQSWFKVSFSVKHSFNTGRVFEAWIKHLWNGHGALTQAGVLFLCPLLGHESWWTGAACVFLSLLFGLL